MKKFFTLAIMALLTAVTVSAETIKTEVIKTDFSDGNGIGGWGGTASFSTEDGVCTFTNSAKKNNWESQACVEVTEAIPVEAIVTMNIKAKASEPYTLRCGLQNPDGYKGCGDFGAIELTDEYQEFTRKVTCNGENALRILFNFGDIEGSIYIDEIEIFYEEEGEEETGNHVLRLIHNEAEGNNWDVQSFIKLSGVESGVANTVKLKIMSTSDFKLGTEAIDQFSEHKSEWGATAVFAYTNEIEVTSKWQEVTIYFPGSTDVKCHAHCTPGEDFNNHKDGDTKHCTAEETNVEYAASHLQLNWGKLPKDAECYIDDVVVYSAAGEAVSTVDFEESKVVSDNYSADVTSVGWQASRGSAKIIVMEVPEIETAISNVTVDSAKAQKALKNGQIVITRGAKAYNAVGQEL
mgnify:CR=1 FL=1